jgi:hypothetical protein
VACPAWPSPARRAARRPSAAELGLQSREGKQLQKTVLRGVFGMLKKKL